MKNSFWEVSERFEKVIGICFWNSIIKGTTNEIIAKNKVSLKKMLLLIFTISTVAGMKNSSFLFFWLKNSSQKKAETQNIDKPVPCY